MIARVPLLTGAVAMVAATAAVTSPPAGARSPTIVEPTQALVSLITPHGVYSVPRADRSKKLTTLSPSRPFTGGPTVLPVVGHRTDANRARWLRVMIPGRPNGRRGWIAKRGTSPSSTKWHLIVRTSTRRVLVYRRGRLDRSFTAIVGKPSTPTPHGRFFVEESVRMIPGSAGGPFALVLSARSNVLQEYGGGKGEVALHGLANLGGTLGTAISHGCVRLANANISWLAERIAPGTPVTIKR